MAGGAVNRGYIGKHSRVVKQNKVDIGKAKIRCTNQSVEISDGLTDLCKIRKKEKHFRNLSATYAATNPLATPMESTDQSLGRFHGLTDNVQSQCAISRTSR
jgi:hypothetical protein